jgi:uroporphyrinogen III methyltransferase/synthase
MAARKIIGFMVYLIGAGPGDPGLLTLAGADALRNATAVVHDALIGTEILKMARSDAKVYDVGKRAGQHKATQEEINALLIQLAHEGHTVARLKGGDPFVFGRGGEEAQALKEAGIPFRVIPGVTSAIAVPAAAGIPVTQRGIASSVAIITAHRIDDAAEPDWHALARIDTVVILMGAERVAVIAARLMQAGRDAATPAACIQSGTLPEQQQVVGTLSNIADLVQAARLGSPLVMVVGRVVDMRSILTMTEQML